MGQDDCFDATIEICFEKTLKKNKFRMVRKALVRRNTFNILPFIIRISYRFFSQLSLNFCEFQSIILIFSLE